MTMLPFLCTVLILFIVIPEFNAISSSGNIMWTANCRCKCECKNGTLIKKSDCPCGCKCIRLRVRIRILHINIKKSKVVTFPVIY